MFGWICNFLHIFDVISKCGIMFQTFYGLFVIFLVFQSFWGVDNPMALPVLLYWIDFVLLVVKEHCLLVIIAITFLKNTVYWVPTSIVFKIGLLELNHFVRPWRFGKFELWRIYLYLGISNSFLFSPFSFARTHNRILRDVDLILFGFKAAIDPRDHSVYIVLIVLMPPIEPNWPILRGVIIFKVALSQALIILIDSELLTSVANLVLVNIYIMKWSPIYFLFVEFKRGIIFLVSAWRKWFCCTRFLALIWRRCVVFVPKYALQTSDLLLHYLVLKLI